MLRKLKRKIRNEFEPTLWGLFFNPFYIARKDLYKHIKELSVKINGKILDIGCGRKPYEKLFNAEQYVGLEIDTTQNRKQNTADYFYDGGKFPFEDYSFDSVITNQVLEHVFSPNEFIDEISRVLKPNGMLLLTVPFAWDEHSQPIDYGRYSSFGLEHILKQHDFIIVDFRKSVDDIRAIFQLLSGYIYKKTITKNKYINIITTLFLIAPCNIAGELFSRILPKNKDFYLDNIVLACRK